jgi:hypothetical protein
MTARDRRRRTVGTAARGALAGLVLLTVGCRSEAASRTADFADSASPAQLVDMVAGMLPRVERLSGLERRDTLRMRWQTRDAARQFVEARLDDEMPPAVLDATRRTYVALGLIPDTVELRPLLLDLYTEQVVGYYDPRSATLYVLREADLASLRPVVIHELVHALQDQHTSLDSIVAQRRGNDRRAAAHAALEGHAMLVMFAALAEEAARRELDPASLPNPATELAPALEAQDEMFPVFRRAPAIIRETLLFPYVGGADFVYQLWQSRRADGRNPAPLDSLLPQSTAQVLQPASHFLETRRDPIELRFESAPDGWDLLREETFGQLETTIFLGEHLGAEARAAADGWAGDRYLLLHREGTGDVVHWVSAWVDADAADRFAAAATRAAAARADRAVAVLRETLGRMPLVRITDAPLAAGTGAFPAPAVGVATP